MRTLLTAITVLTLYQDQMTTGRRSSPVPQMTCYGNACVPERMPSTMQCKQVGAEQWACTANLADDVILGATPVTCEGYDYPDDPYVLDGSCGVEYELNWIDPSREDEFIIYAEETDNYVNVMGGIDNSIRPNTDYVTILSEEPAKIIIEPDVIIVGENPPAPTPQTIAGTILVFALGLAALVACTLWICAMIEGSTPEHHTTVVRETTVIKERTVPDDKVYGDRVSDAPPVVYRSPRTIVRQRLSRSPEPVVVRRRSPRTIVIEKKVPVVTIDERAPIVIQDDRGRPWTKPADDAPKADTSSRSRSGVGMARVRAASSERSGMGTTRVHAESTKRSGMGTTRVRAASPERSETHHASATEQTSFGSTRRR